MISALLTGCSDSSDDDLEAYRAEQDAAVDDIAEMLNDSGPRPTVSYSASETTTATQRSYSRSDANYQDHSKPSGQRVEPPIRRDIIDPSNDKSGQSGRDDNRGVYYHNSVDWKWLEQPGGVVPGGRIYNSTQSTICSTGFLASGDARLFIITAGHCGNRGDQFYVEDSHGNWAYVGEMVEPYV